MNIKIREKKKKKKGSAEQNNAMTPRYLKQVFLGVMTTKDTS